MKAAVPVLRSFDERKARDFYIDFLGFNADWEHRFEEGMPLYMQISKGECVIHLSEHHGDATPGSTIRIETPGLATFCEQLRAKGHPNCRPGSPRKQPWGLYEIDLADPFGNRLTLYSENQDS